MRSDLCTGPSVTHRIGRIMPVQFAVRSFISGTWIGVRHGTQCADLHGATMNDREAKARAVKILAKSIYRDLEAQGFDERQIVSLATELISEVTNKISRGDTVKSQLA